MVDIAGLMKKAQNMQAEMEKVKAQLEVLTVEGVSGGGMVKVTLTGKGEAKNVFIDSSVMSVDEKEILEDLLVAAFNDAKKKIEKAMQEEMGKVTSSMGLPAGMTPLF